MTGALLFLCMPNFRFYLAIILTLGLLISCSGPSSQNQLPENHLPEGTIAALKIGRWNGLAETYRDHPIAATLKGELFHAFFSSYPELCEAIYPEGSVYLTAEEHQDSLRTYTLFGTQKTFGFIPDSIPGLKRDSLASKESIQTYSLDSEVFYATVIDSLQFISTSNESLEKIRNGKVLKDPEFLKAFKVKKGKDLTYVGKAMDYNASETTLPFAETTAYELQWLPDGLIAHGVVLNHDSIPQVLHMFKGQLPQPTRAPEVILASAQRATSMAFSNVDSLQSQFQRNLGDSLMIDPIFETSNELVVVTADFGNYAGLNSLDLDLSMEHLARYLTEQETYREVKLYKLSSEATLFTPFQSLFPTASYSVVFEWDQFILFTESTDNAHEIISGLLNESTLAKAAFYDHAATYIAKSASLMYYEMKGRVSGVTASLFASESSTVKGYPLWITQLIYDRDFAHLNMVAKSASGQTVTSLGAVKQLASIKLDNPLLHPPKFFTNHNTGGQDIVVQDLANQLYLISSNGKILWKEQLDGPILGAISEVDILRNGKKQLAFATRKSVYVLDRNGNPVAPFPKKFQDPITQPLAVFDYDNNRRYRFVVTQKDRVYMYDREGKSVRGFAFDKASSEIVLPPQHIRIGNKDYIIIAEENGNLNILSRVGKIRVPVPKKLRFSEIPIEKEGSDFVVITKDKTKVSISQSGTLSSVPLNVTDTYYFTIYGNTKLTLDDNLMRLNGKLTELPIGLYSKPQLLPFGKTMYATITETKERKVYVYTKSGDLLNHFPLYGNSEIDLGDANRNGKMNVVVQGDADEILLYQLPY